MNIQFVSPVKTINLNNEWICENIPCILVYINDVEVCIKPFNKSNKFNICVKIYNELFIPLENNTEYVHSYFFPNGKIPITEFYVEKISKQKIKKYFKEHDDCKKIFKIIDKIFQDAYISKGSTFCITIDNYEKYTQHPIKTKLQRIGDPIFNRSQRHTTPISKTFTQTDFENSRSFPAPIGIRKEDFAYPSEQNQIVKELLQQFFNSENSPVCPDELKILLDIEITPNSHICCWCGKLMNFTEINQLYCSKQHSINFCHRIPDIGTKPNNVYFGCGDCNRQQGGYSEKERIEQIARLVNNNKEHLEYLLSLI